MVAGAVSMLIKSPSAAFALSDLLSATCRQKGGIHTKAVLQRLVEELQGSSEGAETRLGGQSDQALQAPSHLLAVLTAENPTLATTAYEQGKRHAIEYPCFRHFGGSAKKWLLTYSFSTWR